MSRYWSKFCYLKGGSVTLNENFRGKGASPTNDFWLQRSRVPGLSYGKKIAEKFNRLSRVHQRHRRQTDRRQTDGSAIAYSERERKFTSAKNQRRNIITLHTQTYKRELLKFRQTVYLKGHFSHIKLFVKITEIETLINITYIGRFFRSTNVSVFNY